MYQDAIIDHEKTLVT